MRIISQFSIFCTTFSELCEIRETLDNQRTCDVVYASSGVHGGYSITVSAINEDADLKPVIDLFDKTA